MGLTDTVNGRRIFLNDKFYNLPKEKQNVIINAGYRVFSENSYKKSPMSEIAKEAGISKSLLFHYFKNKKEFYLYLYNHVFSLMSEIAVEEMIDSKTDFFDGFLLSLKYQRKLVEQHVYSFRFMMKTFYEDDEEVASDLIQKNNAQSNDGIKILLSVTDKSKFKEGVDIEQLINIITWCLEGFWKEKFCISSLDMNEVHVGYEKIIDFFRKSFYKKEYLL
jgi:TetR/AcrR family transcriptional regulator